MTSRVLDNGLKVLVQEVHTAPLASVWCWYKVGSKDERTGLTGVSHWVEHMNFKGTKNIPREDIKGIIEKFGGSWNGYTWIDQTTYMETASTAGLDRMLFIESERMSNCIYDPEDCESERTVIISELQGGENDPDTLLEQEVIAAAYKVHPYRHPTIGWLSDLQSMTRDDLYDHYRSHYVPNNATVVVVGDVEADDVLRRVDKQFGGIPAGPTRRRVSVGRAGAARRAARSGFARGQYGLSEAGVSRAGRRRSRLLSDARAGRDSYRSEGHQSVVELPHAATAAKRATVSVACRATPRVQRSVRELLPTEHPFLYLISATALDGVGLGDVEAAATACLDDVAKNGITDKELTKAKNQLRARLVFENDSVTNLGHQVGYFETIATQDVYSQAPALIAKVTEEDVEQGCSPIPSNRSPNRRLVSAAACQWEELMSVGAAKGLAASRTVLDNGVVVISKEARTVPAVTIQMSSLAGSIYESDEQLGLSNLTSRVLDRGTATRSSEEIAEALDARGVSLSVSANRHVLTVSCTCLSEDFETLFDLLGDIVDAARVSRGGSRHAQGRGAEPHQAGGRQPRGNGNAPLVWAALSRPTSVRPACKRHRRDRRPHRPRRSRAVSRVAFRPFERDGRRRGRRRASAR